MTSSYSLKCPGCGEANSADMAFCIFCGAPLKSSAPTGATPSPNPTESGTRVSAVGVRPRTCVNCGQTDSLNSQFCIFCGARVDGPVGGAGAISGARPAAQSMSEPRSAEQRAGRPLATGLIAAVFAGLLGAGLGLGMAWWYDQSAEPAKPGRELPAKGLVILTGKPYSTFEIISDDRHFVTGKTGKDGDVALETVSPDKYHVRVISRDGNDRWEGNIVVKPGEPYIIGGQTELFTQ